MSQVQQLIAQAKSLMDAGRLADAEATLRQALIHQPSHSELLNQTGLLCFRQGKFPEAEELFAAAARVNPAAPIYWVHLAESQRGQGKWPQVIESAQRALSADRQFARAYVTLADALRTLHRVSESIAVYEEGARLCPKDGLILNNLANAYWSQGRAPEAIARLRKCVEVSPNPAFHSSLVYTLWFDPDKTLADIVAEHARWSQRWEAPLAGQRRSVSRPRDANKRLRVGYVSPDFRQHVIALFMQPILQLRDRNIVESFCYSDVAAPDFMTERLKSHSDHWVNTAGMPDAKLAERIAADGIDILVDLTAQMFRNRLLVFARKPAPVQVSYLAYAGTTGLAAMDYRLSDPYLDPLDTPTFGTEKVIRLPETYWCYVPQIEMPEVAPRPSGPIVFGCFNNCAKINRLTIDLWSEILRQLPESRLRLIVYGGESGNGHIKQSFQQHGIEPARIELIDKVNYWSYFPLYNDVHIALDPFPYNGGTTTIDALYMGVPVISLTGSNGMSRAGVSILTNAGLPELIAATPEEYASKTVTLARDREKLNALSASLRQRVKDSPLMNAPKFVRNLEAAYRWMWNEHN